MESQERLPAREREKTVYRYSNALARGDFDTITAILKKAEADSTLERMILDWNASQAVEQQIAIDSQDAALVRSLIARYITSADADDTETDLPRPTVSDVIARMQIDTASKKYLEREDQSAISQLQRSEQALPRNLTQRGVREIFNSLGVSVSQSFERLFRDTAIFLSMGHEQGSARLAATRRQRRARRNLPTQDAESSSQEDP